MPRPPKKGLAYFPTDVDVFDDYKIVNLLNQYGTIGFTIYIRILALIYREGYYLAIPMEDLVLIVIKDIGNKWIKDKNLVLQVVYYCAEIGLFDTDLLRQSVITSAGIQRRYAEVTVRNKVKKDQFWILDSPKFSESVSENGVSVTKTRVSVTETPENDAKTPTNKIKENKSKSNKEIEIPKEILDAWNGYIEMRSKIKRPLTDRAKEMALNHLRKLAPNDYAKQCRILDQSTLHCWQGLFPLQENPKGDDSSFDLNDAIQKATINFKKYSVKKQ